MTIRIIIERCFELGGLGKWLSNELKRKDKIGLTPDVGSGHNPRGDVNVDISSIFCWLYPEFC